MTIIRAIVSPVGKARLSRGLDPQYMRDSTSGYDLRVFAVRRDSERCVASNLHF